VQEHVEPADRAARLMELMEKAGVGSLAVSPGCFKTLFGNSGKSTSAEVPEEIQREMGVIQIPFFRRSALTPLARRG
jgi:hypothetical protein